MSRARDALFPVAPLLRTTWEVARQAQEDSRGGQCVRMVIDRGYRGQTWCFLSPDDAKLLAHDLLKAAGGS